MSDGHLRWQGDGGAVLRVEEIAGHEEAGGEGKIVGVGDCLQSIGHVGACLQANGVRGHVGACLQANGVRGQARSYQRHLRLGQLRAQGLLVLHPVRLALQAVGGVRAQPLRRPVRLYLISQIELHSNLMVLHFTCMRVAHHEVELAQGQTTGADGQIAGQHLPAQ